MTKLPILKACDIIRKIRRIGFYFSRQKGSHAIYYRASDNARITVPVHGGADIAPDILFQIIEDTGVSREKFLNL